MECGHQRCRAPGWGCRCPGRAMGGDRPRSRDPEEGIARRKGGGGSGRCNPVLLRPRPGMCYNGYPPPWTRISLLEKMKFTHGNVDVGHFWCNDWGLCITTFCSKRRPKIRHFGLKTPRIIENRRFEGPQSGKL